VGQEQTGQQGEGKKKEKERKKKAARVLLQQTPYLLTTRVVHELNLDGLRADDGKARF
jgi:hypothetical protein